MKDHLISYYHQQNSRIIISSKIIKFAQKNQEEIKRKIEKNIKYIKLKVKIKIIKCQKINIKTLSDKKIQQQFLSINLSSQKMTSRRTFSPTRARGSIEPSYVPGLDQRDLIIKKLKEDLIIARNKQKQVVILENYLLELKQKIRILGEELRRKQNDIRSRTDISQKQIAQLKRQIQILKSQLKNRSIGLGESQASLLQLKRHLAKRSSQLEKIRKQTLYLKQQNQSFRIENSNLISRYGEIQSQLIRIESTNRDYDDRISGINSKIAQVRAYIGELNNQTRILKDKLKKFEQENNNFSDELNAKQDNIDDLERVFSEEHDLIKNQIDAYIELEHKNQRLLTQIRHKINLNKAENQKSNQLNLAIQKVQKAIAATVKQNQGVQEQVKKVAQQNNQYSQYNTQLTRDLAKCHEHLQNLMKYNSQIQSELQKYLREDEEIITVIRRKRVSDFVPMRQSRNFTERMYR